MVSLSTACGSANNNLSAIDCMYCGAWSEVSYQQQQQKKHLVRISTKICI